MRKIMKKGNTNYEEEKGKRDLKRRRSRLTTTGALGILPLADPTQRGLIAGVLWLLVLPIESSLVWLGINRVRTWLRFAERLLLTLLRVWLDQIHQNQDFDGSLSRCWLNL